MVVTRVVVLLSRVESVARMVALRGRSASESSSAKRFSLFLRQPYRCTGFKYFGGDFFAVCKLVKSRRHKRFVRV